MTDFIGEKTLLIKEILNKAGLESIAANLDLLEEINLTGGSPKEILGLSMKVMRTFNTELGVKVIANESDREELQTLYQKSPDIFRKQWNETQCLYWIARRGRGLDRKEIIKVLKMLENRSSEAYSYIFYDELREALIGVVELPLIPEGERWDDTIYKAAYLERCLELEKFIDNNLQILAYKNRMYQYEDERYCVIVPQSMKELLCESAYQQNCIWSYLLDIAYGNTTVLFMRSTKNKGMPYISIEVKNEMIVQAKGHKNKAVREEEKRWIYDYASVKNLLVAPCDDMMLTFIDDDEDD